MLRYDLIFVGGGIAASLLAIRLIRQKSDLQILIIEQAETFPPKLGESLSEIAALYLRRFEVGELLEKHLAKSGLRFLFQENKSTPDSYLEFASPSIKGIANGFHLKRHILDEDLLQLAAKLGVEIWRPAQIQSIHCQRFSNQLEVKWNGKLHTIQSPWLVDASGKARFLCRKLNWSSQDLPLQTAAVVAHFEGERTDLTTRLPQHNYWHRHAIGPPENATIHFMGPGYWTWHIALDEHRLSLGFVYDKNQHQVDDPEAFFDELLQQAPTLKYMVGKAQRGPVRKLDHLPYLSQHLYAEGQLLIGDSGAFVEPLFSPGIEQICQQSVWLSHLLKVYYEKAQFSEKAWKNYEQAFFRAIKDRAIQYEIAYKLMFSYDLFSSWTQLGLFAYFTLSVYPAVYIPRLIKYPLTFTPLSRLAYQFIARRYLRIAERRLKKPRFSESLPQPISYSFVSVPSGPRLLLKPVQLLWNWLINYLRIEWTELRR